MTTPVCTIRLSREYRAIEKAPIPYIETHPSPVNILSWSFVITGPPDTPYHNGQYYGRLTFPKTFPYAAPKIQMITPSARFIPSTEICTTFTSMHPEEWNPAWTVETILTGFLSFMTSDEIGTGSVHPHSAEGSEGWKRRFAQESKKWNSLHCPRFRQDFPDLHAANLRSEMLTEKELEMVNAEDCDVVTVSSNTTDITLMDTSYESHVNEDWDKFGSMEEDWDDYDDEEEDEQDDMDEDMQKDYQSSDTDIE